MIILLVFKDSERFERFDDDRTYALVDLFLRDNHERARCAIDRQIYEVDFRAFIYNVAPR